MKWFLAKTVYRIICGNGKHTAQFDEQLRLICADDETEAFEKASHIGRLEEESFMNDRQQLVCWNFVNVSELHLLDRLTDGAEIYSRINEVDNAEAYITFVNRKADSLKEKAAFPYFLQ